MSEEFCFVSCDIISHSAEQIDIQEIRIQELNDIIAEAIALSPPGSSIWASGGDGGHFATPCSSGASGPINLITTLRHWATNRNVPLRVIAHVGTVSRLERSADSSVQLVGSGINMCGSILGYGANSSVVVSQSCRSFFEKDGISGLRFKAPRTVYLKHFKSHRLYLLDIADHVSSHWGAPTKSDRLLLSEVPEDDPWMMIYFAKRLLQANSADQNAIDALDWIITEGISYLSSQGDGDESAFIRELDSTTFLEFVQGSDLVERENGEILCDYDDEGDAMFIVVRGSIGIILGDPNKNIKPDAELSQYALEDAQEAEDLSDSSSDEQLLPDLRIGPGRIVGELAFALKRKRTARLQAVGRTAVLAFSNRGLQEIFDKSDAPQNMREANQRFIDRRTLEHICNKAPYLVGPRSEGPLAESREPWQNMIRGAHFEKITVRQTQTHTIDAESDHRLAQDGIYILASGVLMRRPTVNGDRVLLDGRDLPILYTDFPGHFVRMHHRFRVVSDEVVIIRIAHAAFQRQNRGMYHDAIVKAAMSSMGADFTFDVFIAYDSTSHDDAEFWARELQARGNRVYINEPKVGENFKAELGAALVDSRVLLPIISARVSNEARQTESDEGLINWVQTEIQMWLSVYDKTPESENIVPIELAGARTESVLDGCTAIRTNHPRSMDAIESANDHIQRIISRDYDIPKATKRLWLPDDFC